MAATAAAAIVLTACALTACGSSPGNPPPDVPVAAAASPAAALASRTLSETGSSLMAPLFSLWAPAYHARFSQVTLHTVRSSSGQGISSAAAGTDIGASDAFLSPATLARYSHLVNIPLPSSVITLSDAQIARIKG
jgi:phosphate transport system substrate-binding protein